MIWSVRQNASASLLYITSTATVAMAVEQRIYPPQHAKKVVSDNPGLVDFAIGLVIFVLN